MNIATWNEWLLERTTCHEVDELDELTFTAFAALFRLTPMLRRQTSRANKLNATYRLREIKFNFLLLKCENYLWQKLCSISFFLFCFVRFICYLVSVFHHVTSPAGVILVEIIIHFRRFLCLFFFSFQFNWSNISFTRRLTIMEASSFRPCQWNE